MTHNHPHLLRGIVLLLVALLFFALLDVSAKYLAQTFAVPFLVWARYTLHCLLMIIILGPRMGRRLIYTRRPGMQIIRALALLGCTSFGIAALSYMPLAETTALVFITPLLVTLLAGPILKEKTGLLRTAVVGIGLLGVLFIARPGGALNGIGILFALSAAICYAGYQIMTRLMSASEAPLTLLFYTAVVGTLVTTLGLPWYWSGPSPSWQQWGLIAALGLCGGTGHMLLTYAFRYAPASTLSPFLYVQLIWATLLGGLIFDHWPDHWAVVGMLIIGAAGLVLAIYEHRQHRRNKTAPTPRM